MIVKLGRRSRQPEVCGQQQACQQKAECAPHVSPEQWAIRTHEQAGGRVRPSLEP